MAVSIIGEAGIRLRPEASGFGPEAEVGIFGPLKEVAGKAAGIFAGAFAAEKIFDYAKDSVKAYSDTTEAATRSQTVFGASFEEVQKFAEGAATSIGQSESSVLSSASTFGNLFRSMGVTSQASADMSTKFVSLASDMASFNNVPIDQALSALQSGVVGMTRPLREYGVNLDQASIKTEAARVTLESHGQVTGKAAQVQAAYNLIMKQTTLTQGDFTRTATNLADQQRILAAESENLKDKVGSAIYPFVDLGVRGITGTLMPALIKLASPMEKVGEGAKIVNEDLAELTGSAKAAYQGYSVAGDTWATRLGIQFGHASSVTQGFWTTFTDAAKGGGVGIGATEHNFEGFVIRFGDQLHGLQTDATASWMSIRTSAMDQLGPLEKDLSPVLASLKATFNTALSGLFGGVGSSSGAGIIAPIASALNAVTPLITSIIGKVGPAIQSFLPVVASVVGAIVPVVANLVHQIVPLLGQIIPVVMQLAGLWQSVLKTAFEALLPVLPVVVNAIGQLVTTLVGGLGPIIRAIVPVIHELIGILLQMVTHIVGALLPVLPILINALLTVGQTIAKALIAVLQALLPILPPIVNVIGQVAQVLVGALGTALQSLAPVLATLVNALLQLVMTALQPLLPLLPTLASLLTPIISVFGAIVQALAPFLPLIAQVVGMLVQLLVVALQPLMPIITIVANLIGILLQVLVPIITIVADVIAVLIHLAAIIITTVVGAISGVIQWFQHLLSELSGIFSRIGTAFSSAFSGIQSTVAGIFHGVVGVVKAAINDVIGVINGAIGFINRDLIGTINKVPGVTIPNIPSIPKLHEGGVFSSPTGEGLALLRDRELVVTPEQRSVADNLLSDLLSGTAPASAADSGPGGGGLSVTNHITQQPGEDGTVLAARVTNDTVWRLNTGTRRVGTGSVTP